MRNDHDQDAPRGVGFVLGLLVGTALGTAIGLLLAPRAGSDLRGDIRQRARDMGQKAAGTYREMSDDATDLVERGRQTVSRVRSAASSAAHEVRQIAARAKRETVSDPTTTSPPSES